MSPQNHGPARRTPPRRPVAKRPTRAVYMRRRAIVFGTPVVLLVAIIVMFSGGGSKPQQASLSSQTTTPVAPPSRHASSSGSPATQIVDPNAIATSSCTPSAIQVTPSITGGVAGGPITIDLSMVTTEAACNFSVSGSTVAVKLMSGTNSLWSSQDCPNVIPAGTLTLRKASPVDVSLTWDGHQSSGSCGATNPWVGPGTYRVLASVIGSTPTSANFSLKLPAQPTITKTATPKVTKKPTSSARTKTTATKQKSSSAGVHGKGTSCGGDNAPGTC